MKKISLFIFGFLFLFQSNTSASHVMGGEITYKYISTNTYEVSLALYRDCNGISMGNQETVSFTSPTCGTITEVLHLESGYPEIVTPICANEPDDCNSVPGSVYGIHKYLYKAIVTLPLGCWSQNPDIVISWSSCCRHPSNTTLSGQPAFYLYATLNSSIVNDTPEFLNDPLFLVTSGNQTIYSNGGFDTEHDSLVFSLVDCKSSSLISTNYMLPFDGMHPISTLNGISMNPQTGEMIFTPTNLQRGPICIIVEEFRNGVKIGEIYRDINIQVLGNGPNNNPLLSGINGTTDATGTTGDFELTLNSCNLDTITFDITAFDLDTSQMLTWDTIAIPQGADFTVNGNNTGTFKWMPTPSQFGKKHIFAMKVQDDVCPVPSHIFKLYTINLEPYAADTISTSSTIVNVNETVQLQAPISNTFCSVSWSGTSSLSCSNCPNPIFTADSTTTVIANVSCNTGCSYTDTITIEVRQQIKGNITTSYGAPLANSLVNIYDASPQLIQTLFTDNNGNYVFNNSGAYLSNATLQATPSISFPTEKTTYHQGGMPVALYAQNEINFSTEDAAYNVTGTVFKNNGLPLSHSKVILLDAGYDTLATVPTDANGDYSYSTYEPFIYFIATPDSTLHPDQLITYAYTGSPVIQGANLIDIQNLISLDVFTAPLVTMPNGNQTIGGVVLDPISNLPVTGVRVLLTENNQTVVGVDYTSEMGRFEFENIDTGTFRIWVDQLGIDNALTNDIPFLSNTTTIMFDSLLCFLHSNYLEVNLVNVSTEEALEVSKMTVQPNPATADVYLNIELEVPTQTNISIYNLSGQLIGKVFEGQLKAGEQRYELSSILQDFNGICMIKIQTPTGVITKRLLYFKK